MNPPKRTRRGRRGKRKPAEVTAMTAPGLEDLTVSISADAPDCCKAAAAAGFACGCDLYDDGEE